jgi:predicted Zn-dependent peptidase
MAIVASGNVDFNQLIKDAEKYCGHWQPRENLRTYHPATANFSFSTLAKETSAQQYVMQLSPGPATDDADRYAMRILTTILGDDSGSRLFWEMLDTGLAESAAIGSYEFLGAGMVMSYFCCDPDQAQENLERLHKIQASATKGITPRELELAKQKIVSHILLASERTESRMFSVGGQWLAEQEFKTPAQLAECYKAVTLNEVLAVAEKYSLTRNCTLCVGPRDDMRPVS